MRTLIVDDHQLFAAGLRLLLGSLVPLENIERCADGQAALRSAQAAPFDLVLLDWRLGSQPSGAQLIHAIAEVLPAARQVVISGEADPAIVLAAIEAGAVGFVPKESSPELMTAALMVVFSGGIYLPATALAHAGVGGPVVGPMSAGQANAAHAQAPSVAPTLGRLATMAERVPELSPRQLEVLGLLVRGQSNKLIARHLDIAEGTVKQHANAIYRLMNVNSRTEAVYRLAQWGVRLD